MLDEPTALAAAERPRPDEGEQRGQQRHGRGDGEHDGQRGRDGDPVEEAEPQDEHAEQCDADGRTGEDHGPPGRRHGPGRGLVDGEPLAQAPAVPGDDEQGVVDADAEPDEQAEHGREVGDGHGVAEQPDARVRGADGDHRGDDGQDAGGERAEGEEEDDGRDDHADDLAEVRGAGLGERGGAAADRDVEAVGGGGLRGVDDVPRLGLGDLTGGVVEGDGGVGGAPVGADLRAAVAAVRTAHGGHTGELRDRAEGLGHALLYVGGAYGSGVGAPDDRVGVAAAAAVEPGVEQGGGAAGLGARDFVVVGVRGAGDGGGGRGAAEREEPEQDGDEAVPDAPPCDGCQRMCSLDGSWIFAREQPVRLEQPAKNA